MVSMLEKYFRVLKLQHAPLWNPPGSTQTGFIFAVIATLKNGNVYYFPNCKRAHQLHESLQKVTKNSSAAGKHALRMYIYQLTDVPIHSMYLPTYMYLQ